MKVKFKSKEIFGIAKWKIRHGIDMIKTTLHRLTLTAFGFVSNFSTHASALNNRAGASISPDGRYMISWSWKGLIYLIDLGVLGPPIVISFVLDRGLPQKFWGAHFSGDMRQIVVTHDSGAVTILSSVPGEGFHRRKFPITQDWLSDVPHVPARNIVEFIYFTSSAYWKHMDNSKYKDRGTFPVPPPTDLDCDWRRWISRGERFLDIPRDTCKLDG